MVMVFTLVSGLQDKLGEILENLKKEKEEEVKRLEEQKRKEEEVNKESLLGTGCFHVCVCVSTCNYRYIYIYCRQSFMELQ